MSALPTFRFEPEWKEPDELQSPIFLVAQRNAWRELAELQADFLIDTAAHNAPALRKARRQLLALGQDVSRV